MKKSHIEGVDLKRMEETAKSPKLLRLRELFEKVESGTATEEERREFEERTRPVRELDPNVLVD